MVLYKWKLMPNSNSMLFMKIESNIIKVTQDMS